MHLNVLPSQVGPLQSNRQPCVRRVSIIIILICRKVLPENFCQTAPVGFIYNLCHIPVKLGWTNDDTSNPGMWRCWPACASSSVADFWERSGKSLCLKSFRIFVYFSTFAVTFIMFICLFSGCRFLSPILGRDGLHQRCSGQQILQVGWH